ncbi:hypothetical protein CPB85DRAFT_1372858 [Mucidula mucida]|nr:hypothetical protein CPB85DRAFT_1372858 [Mucidula mucida]
MSPSPPENVAALFKPLTLGSGVLTLPNRIVLAALTRNRAVPTTVPNEVMKDYYLQRADAGLLITEAIPTSYQGTEWANAPCLHTEEHVAAWKTIIDAVHEKGTLIFGQLWHAGRVCHPDMPLQAGRVRPTLGPSAIGARDKEKFRLLPGYPGYVTPTEIPDPQVIVDEFKQGAINAKKAGFDGVELHASNGYLINQFIDSSSNQRTDAWGGSVEKRAKFVLELLKECVAVFGEGRVGIKFSPCGGYNDMGMPLAETLAQYSYILTEANKLPLAYICLARWSPMFETHYDGTYRKYVTNFPFWLNVAMLPEESAQLINEGKIDGVEIGIPFIVNPDLVKRVLHGKELSVALDVKRIYGFGPNVPLEEQRKGYTDYPTAEY